MFETMASQHQASQQPAGSAPPAGAPRIHLKSIPFLKLAKMNEMLLQPGWPWQQVQMQPCDLGQWISKCQKQVMARLLDRPRKWAPLPVVFEQPPLRRQRQMARSRSAGATGRQTS